MFNKPFKPPFRTAPAEHTLDALRRSFKRPLSDVEGTDDDAPPPVRKPATFKTPHVSLTPREPAPKAAAADPDQYFSVVWYVGKL